MKPDDFVQNAEIPTWPIYIQYKGIFDMQDLYDSIAGFLTQKKFKLYEVQQRHRRPSPFGAEILYQFRGEREVEEYYKWIVNITIETFDLHDIEVVLKGGARKKMSKGRLWIKFDGVVTTDYEKVWEKSAFLAHLKSFYNKYVIKKRFEGIYWDELHYNIVLKLHALIRERLKMLSEGYEHRYYSRIH